MTTDNTLLAGVLAARAILEHSATAPTNRVRGEALDVLRLATQRAFNILQPSDK